MITTSGGGVSASTTASMGATMPCPVTAEGRTETLVPGTEKGIKAYASRWSVAPAAGGGCTVRYWIRVEQSAPIPAFLVDPVVKSDVHEMMVTFAKHFGEAG